MKYLALILAIVVSVNVALADDFPADIKSPEVKEAIESFVQMKKSTTTLVTAKIRTYRQELIDKLKAQQKTVTMAGDLEEALKIKKLIGQLEAVQVAAQEVSIIEGENAAGKVNIPRGAVKFNKSHYYIVTEPTTWHIARIKCGLKGGHLVRIESEAEHQFVTKLIQTMRIQSQPEHYHYLFIDGNDEVESKDYRDSSGQQVKFLPWAQGYPKEFGSRFYLMININAGEFFNTYSTRRYYICEWD